LRRLLALAPLAALAACEPAARHLAGGPAGADGASALVRAIAERFGPQDREPEFEALRPKLARAALVPSLAFDDFSAWKRSEGAWRAVEFAGAPTPAGFRLGVRAEASDPVTAGHYRGRIRLERIESGRFEWTVREELAVGGVRPAELASALDALFHGAEATDEAKARAAIASAFPRACAKLGLALRLETLEVARDGQGASSLRVALRLQPAGLKETAPRYATFLARYLTPIKSRMVVADAAGTTWWTLEGENNLWTLRLRVRGGSLVPLEGDAARRIPERLQATMDYATRMGRFSIAEKGLLAEVALTRTPAEKGFLARFQKKPDWDLPFLVEPFLGGPLSYPFEGPGSEAGWVARETPSGTRIVRDYRVRVGENWVLRWLGGMTDRALSEFRAGAEREADRYHGECLLAIRDDVVELLRAPVRAQSPSIMLPRPPTTSSTDPSPLRPRPMPGIALAMRSARRLSGSDCSQTWPGPVSVAKKRPSPPKSAVLTPLTNCTS